MDVDALQWLVIAMSLVSNLCTLMALKSHKIRNGHDGRN